MVKTTSSNSGEVKDNEYTVFNPKQHAKQPRTFRGSQQQQDQRQVWVTSQLQVGEGADVLPPVLGATAGGFQPVVGGFGRTAVSWNKQVD